MFEKLADAIIKAVEAWKEIRMRELDLREKVDEHYLGQKQQLPSAVCGCPSDEKDLTEPVKPAPVDPFASKPVDPPEAEETTRLDELKAEATDLGIPFKANIKEGTLAKKITNFKKNEAAKAEANSQAVDIPVDNSQEDSFTFEDVQAKIAGCRSLLTVIGPFDPKEDKATLLGIIYTFVNKYGAKKIKDLAPEYYGTVIRDVHKFTDSLPQDNPDKVKKLALALIPEEE
jgi:hypothetical protein